MLYAAVNIGADMYIGGIHNDGRIGFKAVVCLQNTVPAQVLQSELQLGVHIDHGIPGVADLNVHAQLVGVQNVVIEAYTVIVGVLFGDVDPVLVLHGGLFAEAQVEYQDLVVRKSVFQRVIAAVGKQREEAVQRRTVDQIIKVVALAHVVHCRPALRINRHQLPAAEYSAAVEPAVQDVDKGACAVFGVHEAAVVRIVLLTLHVRNDLGNIGVGEETAHSILVQRPQIAGIKLFVVGLEEFLHNGFPELAIQHVQKAVVLRLFLLVEQVVKAVDKFILFQLVDIGLEGIVDQCAFVKDLGAFVLADNVLGGHVVHEELFKLLGFKVEEMTGIVPDIVALADGAAVSAHLVTFFKDEIIVLQGICRREPGDPGTHDQIFYMFIAHTALRSLFRQRLLQRFSTRMYGCIPCRDGSHSPDR